jgi:aspartate 1-decarboxylase
VVNINNGARFETYAIVGKPESGEVCLNGAAARLAHVGDIVIIMTFAHLNEKELEGHSPKIIKVDGKNVPAA